LDKFIGQDATDEIGGAAGRKRNDERDGAGRINLGIHLIAKTDRRNRGDGESGRTQKACTHCFLPIVIFMPHVGGYYCCRPCRHGRILNLDLS